MCFFKLSKELATVSKELIKIDYNNLFGTLGGSTSTLRSKLLLRAVSKASAKVIPLIN